MSEEMPLYSERHRIGDQIPISNTVAVAVLPTDHLFKPFFPERMMYFPPPDMDAFEKDFKNIVLEAFAACGFDENYILEHLSEFKRVRTTGIWCYKHNDKLIFTVFRIYCDRTVCTWENWDVKKETILNVEFA